MDETDDHQLELTTAFCVLFVSYVGWTGKFGETWLDAPHRDTNLYHIGYLEHETSRPLHHLKTILTGSTCNLQILNFLLCHNL